MDEIISYKMCAVKVRNAKLGITLNNSRRFLFCQETSQLTSTRLLSFVTGQGESKSYSRENVLL
jgi:hypothetical protein